MVLADPALPGNLPSVSELMNEGSSHQAETGLSSGSQRSAVTGFHAISVALVSVPWFNMAGCVGRGC